jgi:hypothetical protein
VIHNQICQCTPNIVTGPGPASPDVQGPQGPQEPIPPPPTPITEPTTDPFGFGPETEGLMTGRGDDVQQPDTDEVECGEDEILVDNECEDLETEPDPNLETEETLDDLEKDPEIEDETEIEDEPEDEVVESEGDFEEGDSSE